MFFNDDNISVEIISILNPNWHNSEAQLDMRPFYTISFRIIDNADFVDDTGTIHVNSGDIIFIPANHEYSFMSKVGRAVTIHFLSENKLPDKIKVFSPKNPNYFEKKFEELLESHKKKKLGYFYECKFLLYRVIMKLEQEYNRENIKSHDDMIYDAVEYIHDNFTNPELSIDYLAKKCGMSDSSFRNHFKEVSGSVPHKYINDLRMNYAKELIASKYYSVAEISRKCGFSNPNYFCVAIKKATGFTPSVLSEKKLYITPSEKGSATAFLGQS